MSYYKLMQSSFTFRVLQILINIHSYSCPGFLKDPAKSVNGPVSLLSTNMKSAGLSTLTIGVGGGNCTLPRANIIAENPKHIFTLYLN